MPFCVHPCGPLVYPAFSAFSVGVENKYIWKWFWDLMIDINDILKRNQSSRPCGGWKKWDGLTWAPLSAVHYQPGTGVPIFFWNSVYTVQTSIFHNLHWPLSAPFYPSQIPPTKPYIGQFLSKGWNWGKSTYAGILSWVLGVHIILQLKNRPRIGGVILLPSRHFPTTTGFKSIYSIWTPLNTYRVMDKSLWV